MVPPNRIIIDTDPGVDDIIALLLALSAKADELEVLLISLTHGNVGVQDCLRNIISLFHHIEKEREWRKANGRPEGFETLQACKPIVAVGADEPLADQRMMADYFHGIDGLGGIHDTHPHLSPADTWKKLFASVIAFPDQGVGESAEDVASAASLFTASKLPAHEEILRVLRDNEPDTITIVAVGPLTNIAIAAATDTETFLRVKEVVVMGGAIDLEGNITPVAEFNTYADSIAAARVYALTSPNPTSTMPPVPPAPPGKQSENPPPPFLKPYPENLSKQLKLTLFPLDITTPHELLRGQFKAATKPLLEVNSPLAEWATAFLTSTFNKMESLHEGAEGDAVGLALHDPICIWYTLTHAHTPWRFSPSSPEDIRIETSGQWTRGMCIVDRRSRRKREDDVVGEIPGDTGGWLSVSAGNRIWRAVGSPEGEGGGRGFAGELLGRVFGVGV
ncbi:nucleoside hydrolase [Patellaria atrata CBS 101060]|uniref:Nucleoside hydrolase n=1 Tax=Patellaria atrata CBS 101060 TaxID=1346257 RepID=A0A9P4SGL3_9PEZI|nr:nucleoside hydrolase [Patellaria atrata CBS 101060]